MNDDMRQAPLENPEKDTTYTRWPRKLGATFPTT
jgi:hypothetical protein